MRIFLCVRAGVLGVCGSPRMILVLWLLGVAAALPASLAITRSIHGTSARTSAGENLRESFDMDWYGVYRSQAQGIERSFRPSVTGAGAFLDNLEGWATGRMFAQYPALVALGALYALVWTLALGGIIHWLRFPRERFTAGELFAAGGRFFGRFLRLALLSWVAYAGVYFLGRWLYDLVGEATRDVTSERTVLAWSLAVVGVTALLLVVVHLVFAYAKIATVLEDHRSAIQGVRRGAVFVLRNLPATLGLFAVMGLGSLLLVALYAAVAPVAGPSTVLGIALAGLLGQLVLLARLTVNLSLLGAELTLYREATGG